MPTTLKQAAFHPSGTGALVIVGRPVREIESLDGLQLSIVQTGLVDRYLDPRRQDDPWTTAVYRFDPLSPTRDDKSISLEIDYAITFHLRANQPYKLIIRTAGGKEITEIFTYPQGIRQVSKLPDGYVPSTSGQNAAASPTAAPVSVIQKPQVDEDAERIKAEAEAARLAALAQQESDRKKAEAEAEAKRLGELEEARRLAELENAGKSKKGMWIGLLLLLLIVAAAAAWWFARKAPEPTPEPAKTETPAPATTSAVCDKAKDIEGARGCLRSNPDPAAAREAADALTKAGGDMQTRFLLYKYAADKGDVVASRVMGGWYDPDTWTKDSSPFEAANPAEAARWHKVAAEGGDAEAQYRYGMLLKKGRTEEPNGPEQAIGWLRKASDAGNEAARKELPP